MMRSDAVNLRSSAIPWPPRHSVAAGARCGGRLPQEQKLQAVEADRQDLLLLVDRPRTQGGAAWPPASVAQHAGDTWAATPQPSSSSNLPC